jgi:ATP-dependent DNA ligase
MAVVSRRSKVSKQVQRAAAGALPDFIPPQLTALTEEAPNGSEWAHELKWDGYRMHARIEGGEVRLLTRTGLDWTYRYPAMAEALRALPVEQAYLDGELCALSDNGLASDRNRLFRWASALGGHCRGSGAGPRDQSAPPHRKGHLVRGSQCLAAR